MIYETSRSSHPNSGKDTVLSRNWSGLYPENNYNTASTNKPANERTIDEIDAENRPR